MGTIHSSSDSLLSIPPSVLAQAVTLGAKYVTGGSSSVGSNNTPSASSGSGGKG